VISVGEERALAIPLLVDNSPDLDVILLDDAYQHRKVRPSFSVLLTDYHNPFYNDFLMPTGRLRESRKEAGRADIVVVTKCPTEILDDEMMIIEQKIRKYCNKPVFFAGIHYVDPVPFEGTHEEIREKVVLVSGIANSNTLVDYVHKNFHVAHHISFNDHHNYTFSDVKLIAELVKKHNASLLTTEKDAVKLEDRSFLELFSGCNSYYIPIEPSFIKSGRDFDETILSAISRVQNKKDD
jgi:tetraacyldisaccharide 4'-kinase